MLLAAKVWHYWIGVTLFGGAVLTVVGLVLGYLKNVTSPQYPKRNQRSEP
jgi:hypothetical protein